jgi:ATPase subunit of ABC transporter with duplicated ATPase domains
VLIVSHDRYFLDRLVDHVFAFEGNGVVKDFPGNYSEYRQWKYDSEDEAEELAKEQKLKEIISANDSVVEQPVKQVAETIVSEKKKLSYKEQKELESLDVELPQLETKKLEIETLLASGISDVKEIEKLSNIEKFNIGNDFIIAAVDISSTESVDIYFEPKNFTILGWRIKNYDKSTLEFMMKNIIANVNSDEKFKIPN